MGGKKSRKRRTRSFFELLEDVWPILRVVIGGMVATTAVVVVVEHSLLAPHESSLRDVDPTTSPMYSPEPSTFEKPVETVQRRDAPPSSSSRSNLAPTTPRTTAPTSPSVVTPPVGQQTAPDGTAAPLASSSAGLAGYALGGHHVLYVDANQHVQELYRRNESAAWEHYDQSKLVGAPGVAAGSGLAGYAYEGVNYAAYLDGQGHVRGLEWTKDVHKAATDVTLAAGALPAASGTGLAGYALGGHHVIFIDVNQHVQELYRGKGSSKWEVWDQTKLVGAPPAARNSGLAAYAYKGANHVAYADEQGHVQKLEWTQDVHKPAVDLTASANALPAASGTGLAGYVLGGHHVLYVDVNRHVQALFLEDGHSAWSVYDHSAPGDLPPATSAGGLAGYAVDGVNHAAYLGDGGRVLELRWTTNGTSPIAGVVG